MRNRPGESSRSLTYGSSALQLHEAESGGCAPLSFQHLTLPREALQCGNQNGANVAQFLA